MNEMEFITEKQSELQSLGLDMTLCCWSLGVRGAGASKTPESQDDALWVIFPKHDTSIDRLILHQKRGICCLFA